MQGWSMEVTAPAQIRKEQSGINSGNKFLMFRYYQPRNRYSSAASEETTRTTMASPRRVRLSKGFEDLRTQDVQRTKLPIPKRQTPSSSPAKASPKHKQLEEHEHELLKENDAPAYRHSSTAPQLYPYGHAESPKRANEPGSKLPVVSPSSSRRKTQVEKMVSAPAPIPKKHPLHRVRVPAVPSCLLNRRRSPVLTAHIDGDPQVETAMPEAYWLGRFMTLTSAFHYEDSFHAPDTATGFEMPSSYSRPFRSSDDGDLEGYRVKRAFMVLENFCVTDEASESLREFRDAYTLRFGDQWMS